MAQAVHMTSDAAPARDGVLAVDVVELRKDFLRRDKKAGRLARKRRVPALYGVTFAMERGETVAILGQNGSGKSTLIRLLSTLLLDNGGSAHVFGHNVATETRAVRRLINRVSVEASFFKKMSATENLSYAARFYGMPPSATFCCMPRDMSSNGSPIRSRGKPTRSRISGICLRVAPGDIP
jgi:ABC-2 type transport system ATP-binding protein